MKPTEPPARNTGRDIYVYGPNDYLGLPSTTSICEEEASRLVYEEGAANWVNRSKAIQLTRPGWQLLQLGRLRISGEVVVDQGRKSRGAPLKLKDDSCVMDDAITIQAVIERDPYCLSLVAGWAY